MAYNIYGDSAVSVIGDGAIILTVPDAPTTLAEVRAVRAVRSFTVSWLQGYAGGTPVIDYTISLSENMGPVTIFAQNHLSTSVTTTTCTSGATYNIWIQSRNSFGLSEYSEDLQLICAFIPAVPAPPRTSVIANNVILEWDAPNDNGAVILSLSLIHI